MGIEDTYLGKWPRLIVVGEGVTPEQAMEILIRTDNMDLSCNDHEFSAMCGSYLYGVENKRGPGYWSPRHLQAFTDKEGNTNWRKSQEAKRKVAGDLRLLNLQYLHNHRIMSNHIVGPHGWCNWNGYIGCSEYNIGKWPDVSEVYKDWQTVAKAFPYLNLRCQLTLDEDEEVQEPVVEFEVRDGGVDLRLPSGPLETEDLNLELALFKVFHSPYRERGCSFEQFKQAVDYVRERVKDLPPLTEEELSEVYW